MSGGVTIPVIARVDGVESGVIGASGRGDSESSGSGAGAGEVDDGGFTVIAWPALPFGEGSVGS